MAPSSRDRLSVDLQGLKAALLARAQALGMSPSGLVRSALADALGQPAQAQNGSNTPPLQHGNSDRVRIWLRMDRAQAAALHEAARLAHQAPGDFVSDLIARAPILMAGGSRADLLAALVASSAELATLGRNLHHLSRLLRQGEVRAALQYRNLLDTVASDVQAHLALASSVLAALRPPTRNAAASRLGV